ncbi:hypothetical protein [uncultured Winogradskyella sp.]|uniref:hypothetical protein n=1 Tax=uncultured Winogradskyella sp. TaxID=395353 RepID=UPI002614ACFF|nr:hypothetical protein [uncultured Winogradskyella sp.]
MLLSFAIRPIYYVGNVLYYQLNIDYIIEAYCVNKDKPELQCNGKCHLAKQLQIVDNNTSIEKSSISLVYEAFYPLYFQITAQDILKGNSPIDGLNNWKYQSNLKSTFLYNCFHPPRYTSIFLISLLA